MPDPAPLLPFSRPCISEACALEVAEVVRSGWITSGARLARFEADFAAYTGAAHAVALCSGTAGLDLAVESLELAFGDEVIVPSINWVSGPNMVELHGGTCVFAEVEADTLNLDLDQVARLITPRTRAIMPVHFAGAPVDIDALRRLVAGRGILILEDAAHAAGARWQGRAIGGDSDCAVFSFHPTKNLTTAEGGMVTCRDEQLAARLRLGRFHGIRKDAWKNHARSGKDLYQVIAPGRKYNLTDIQATLGLHQLRDLERMNAARTRLAMRYQVLLQDLTVVRPLALPRDPSALHCWHIFVVLVDAARSRVDRAGIIDRLESRGIGTGLHFPPVHTQDYYRRKYPAVRLPVSEDVGARLFSLPLFPAMTDAEQERVVAALAAIQQECGR